MTKYIQNKLKKENNEHKNKEMGNGQTIEKN